MKLLRLMLIALGVALALCSLGARAEKPLKTFRVPDSELWDIPGTTLTLVEPPHPRLFLNPADFEKIRQKAATYPWAKAELDKLLKRAEQALARPLNVPEKAAEWSQHYICKDCGIKLEQQGARNVCPRCGKDYQGWPFDGVIAGRNHIQNFSDARDMALAYQLSGKSEYAAKAREILLAYAERYTKFPIHDYKGGQDLKGARLFAQTLDESVHFIAVAWAYDMIHDAPAMTEADRGAIEAKLFRPLALTIRRNNMTVSNWQTWHNAALAAIGYTLGDADMVDYAINGRSGIRLQLEKSVLPDGFWYEGTPTYHAYSLTAMQYQVMAMRAAGDNIYRDPRYKSLYEAPLLYAWPDGTFPTVNDSERLSISSMDELYELAYAWYGEAKFAGPLSRGSRGETALLFGADNLPQQKPDAAQSTIFPGLGAAMLRAGDMALHVDYGPHGGAHGHFDKLGVILFANGADAAPDPGRLDYAAPMHAKWYKNTVAHNTVIVDGKNQLQAEGRLVASDFSGHAKHVTVACDSAYDDVTLTRTLMLTPDYLVDVMTASAPTTHTWDLAWHVRGIPNTSLPLQPVVLPQQSDGYEVLKNVRAAAANRSPIEVSFSHSGKGDGEIALSQWSFSDNLETSAARVILAEGLTDRTVTTCPVVLNRMEGTGGQWITVVSPGKCNVNVEKRPDGQTSISISTGGRTVRLGTIGENREAFLLTADGQISPASRLH